MSSLCLLLKYCTPETQCCTLLEIKMFPFLWINEINSLFFHLCFDFWFMIPMKIEVEIIYGLCCFRSDRTWTTNSNNIIIIFTFLMLCISICFLCAIFCWCFVERPFSICFMHLSILFDSNRLKWKTERAMLPIRIDNTQTKQPINIHFSVHFPTKCPDYMQILGHFESIENIYIIRYTLSHHVSTVNDLSYVHTKWNICIGWK